MQIFGEQEIKNKAISFLNETSIKCNGNKDEYFESDDYIFSRGIEAFLTYLFKKDIEFNKKMNDDPYNETYTYSI